MKHLGIKLIKYMQTLYTGNYKMAKRNVKDLNKWKDRPHT